jgi:malonate transporter
MGVESLESAVYVPGGARTRASSARRTMTAFLRYLALSAPLFALIVLGYAVARRSFWRREWSRAASKFVFAVPLPALLFHMVSDRSRTMPVDARLLIAFFGSCFIVFVIGRCVGHFIFHLDGVGQSVFGLGGVFSNNVLLGVPLARLTLGPAAMPSVALVLLFNALTLWTLAAVSVEWARHGSLSPRGLWRTAVRVLANPIVIGILCGTVFSLTGLTLPPAADAILSVVGHLAGPLALLVLGMGISEYGLESGWREGVAICVLKLVVHPLVVWGLALALGLPPLQRQVVVLLASLSVGANVYLMSEQFESLKAPVANALVVSTLCAPLTTALLLALAS